MARLILDTSVLVASERDARQLTQLVDDADDVAVAAITVAELLVGVELADARRRPTRRAFVDRLLELFAVEVYDTEVAREHAALLAHVHRSGARRGAHDLVIAATARARARVVLTADRAGFAGLPGVSVR